MGQAEEDPHNMNHPSHHIRSSLYMVKGLLETHLEHLTNAATLAQSGSPNDTQEVLKQTTREINSVLTKLARLNRLRPRLPESGARIPIAVKMILRRLVDALKEEGYLDHVVLIDSVSSLLPQIQINQADLEEIFFNLIVNAIQASGQGGQITIEAITHTDPFPCVAISFRDSGRGLSEDALAHIFDPFVSPPQFDGEGGFGLHLVKQLVERNGGRISVKSQRLFGTTFTITFPVIPD